MAASIARPRALGAASWPDEAESEDVVGSIDAGDHDVAVLYREEAPRLRRMLGRRLSPERTADLVQTAFVRLLAIGKPRRQSLGQPRAYLTRIAGNLLRDDAKFAVRRSEALHINVDDCALATCDPHAMLEARDMLRRIETAIDLLPQRTREIFMAHRFEELTYPQIADRMCVSVKTVEKHISIALRHLHRSVGRANER